MSATLSSLIFRKKITAVFEDGTRKMNLNVASAVALSSGHGQLDVLVDPTEDTAEVQFKQFCREIPLEVSTTPNEKGERTLVLKLDATPSVVEQATVTGLQVAQDFVASAPQAPREESAKPAFSAPYGNPAMPSAPMTAGGRTAYIILGPQAVYTDAHLALRELLRDAGTDIIMSDHYHNKLTQTFLAGSPSGQIKSLFRDLRKYGARIDGKLREFSDFVHKKVASDQEQGRESNYTMYLKWFSENALPTDPRTFTGPRVNMEYFKFWALLQTLKIPSAARLK